MTPEQQTVANAKATRPANGGADMARIPEQAREAITRGIIRAMLVDNSPPKLPRPKD